MEAARVPDDGAGALGADPNQAVGQRVMVGPGVLGWGEGRGHGDRFGVYSGYRIYTEQKSRQAGRGIRDRRVLAVHCLGHRPGLRYREMYCLLNSLAGRSLRLCYEGNMPNRQLTPSELKELFTPLIAEVRGRLAKLSGGAPDLLWALRRKVAKELTYDERGKPMQRRELKARKREQQDGLCAICRKPLPEKDVILDRLKAMAGYTKKNTRLLCRPCDYKVQAKRRFS